MLALPWKRARLQMVAYPLGPVFRSILAFMGVVPGAVEWRQRLRRYPGAPAFRPVRGGRALLRQTHARPQGEKNADESDWLAHMSSPTKSKSERIRQSRRRKNSAPGTFYIAW